MQIPKTVFLNTLTSMKKILDLLEFKMNKNSDEYKYMKKEVMDYTYNALKKTFQELQENKVIKNCPNKCNLRCGFKTCQCGGSGFLNV